MIHLETQELCNENKNNLGCMYVTQTKTKDKTEKSVKSQKNLVLI